MGDHTDPAEQPLLASEPAAAAEAARVILAVLVGAGWLTISSQATDWIISGVGLIASIALTYWTRSNVTPAEKQQ